MEGGSTVFTVLQVAAEGQPPEGSTCHWTMLLWSREAKRERTWWVCQCFDPGFGNTEMGESF